MMETGKLLLFLVGLQLTFTKGDISDECLNCICKVESYGCHAIGCNMDEGSLSCGYYQIKKLYWIDCGKPGTDWETCADNYDCATNCVRAYMARYGPRSGCPDTCETYARIHTGGPGGCKRRTPNSNRYWNRTQAQGCQ